MTDRIGVLIAVLSSTFGGTAAAVTRYVVGAVDPVTIAAFRFGIGVAVLLPLALLLRSALPRGRDWIGVALSRRDVLRGVLRVLQRRDGLHDGGARRARALDLAALDDGGRGAARRRGADRAQDDWRADRGRRRRARAARRARGGARRRVARRPHHGRRDTVHGVLQCLVPAVHRARLAAWVCHGVDGRGRVPASSSPRSSAAASQSPSRFRRRNGSR